MANFYLKYNPYTVESVMRINNRNISEMSKLHGLHSERLQLWLDNLLPILVDECNDDVINIDFHGTLLDYEDLQEYIEEYCSEHPDIKVNIKHKPAKDSENRFHQLRELFDYMQNECPFEDLRDEQIRENFNNAMGSEFEVSVIATMSSGKSTLINAMLGRELLPSKNEACTATIVRIKDVDGKQTFSATYRDINNQEAGSCGNIDAAIMKELNENPEIAYISIEGDIPFITSDDIKLVLLDTPGPNNSRTEKHRDHTYKIIKEQTKPMVLYILNGTQLETDDDNILFASVAEAMKVGGKQSKDRFIFALNKMDEYDPEKESIENVLKNTRTYLEKHGIKNPNIYPISAEMAKVIRLNQKGLPITSKQRIVLGSYELFNENKQMHLSNYAPLNLKNKSNLESIIERAKSNRDPYAEALIHTGIPAIEIAINEYLNKYALTAKVKNAVDTFRKKVEEKQLFNKIIDELNKSQQAREELNQRMVKINQQLNDGKMASELREKIQKLDMAKEAATQVEIIRSKISKTLKGKNPSNKKMTPIEVEKFMKSIQRDVSNLESDTKTDLDQLIDEIIVQTSTNCILEYESYIQSLVEDNTITKGLYSIEKPANFLASSTPNVAELIRRYKYTESVKCGEEWVENTDKKWYKPWTWFDEKWYLRDSYEDVEYVDSREVWDNFVRPVMENFNKNLKNAKIFADEEADRFKNYFLAELNKLDEMIKQKVTELEEITGSQKVLEQYIEENEFKKDWLQSFLLKLDEILEI